MCETKTHTIKVVQTKKGDTLRSIVKRYNCEDRLDIIKKCNEIEDLDMVFPEGYNVFIVER